MIPSLTDAEGRRAWAFAAILGGAAVMTAFAAVVLYLVRAEAGLAFWMGMMALAIVFTCITGFIALFVKRVVVVGRDGVSITDQPDAIQSGDQVTVVKDA